MEALSKRQSTREFDPEKQLSEQTLSDLLWAAWGTTGKINAQLRRR